jgi:hypothetical protein
MSIANHELCHTSPNEWTEGPAHHLPCHFIMHIDYALVRSSGNQEASIKTKYNDLLRWKGTIAVHAFESEAGVLVNADDAGVQIRPTQKDTDLITNALGSECVVELATDSLRDVDNTTRMTQQTVAVSVTAGKQSATP